MGVDHPIGFILAPQMHKAVGEHEMLENIGEVSSVEGVSVIHEADLPASRKSVILHTDLISEETVTLVGMARSRQFT